MFPARKRAQIREDPRGCLHLQGAQRGVRGHSLSQMEGCLSSTGCSVKSQTSRPMAAPRPPGLAPLPFTSPEGQHFREARGHVGQGQEGEWLPEIRQAQVSPASPESTGTQSQQGCSSRNLPGLPALCLFCTWTRQMLKVTLGWASHLKSHPVPRSLIPDHWCGLALLGWLCPRAWGWALGGQALFPTCRAGDRADSRTLRGLAGRDSCVTTVV